jgi:hypothetical protein
MTTHKSSVSVKLSEAGREFYKKFRLNIIRAGGSEKALDISSADLMDLIVKYFKTDSLAYTKMVEATAKNV